MNIFERATIYAVELLISNKELSPEIAWKKGLQQFTDKNSVINKPCPKNTFIDLCYNGYIKNVCYPKRELSENGKMAIESIKILKSQNWNISNKKAFWENNFSKAYQNQLEIIFALKDNNFLIN